MDITDRLAFVEVLNDYAFDDNVNSLTEKLNEVLSQNDYSEELDLIFMAIATSQMYGFLSYLTDEEQQRFFECDYYRSNSYRGINVPFYNRGQLSFLYELENNEKVFFSAPTSFGKTSIVSEYILNHYRELQNVLFVVPTNSLLEELFQKFQRYNLNLKMGYNVTTQPINPVCGRNIAFLTPERFMLVAENDCIDRFDLIVMDETYKIVDAENTEVSDFVNHRALRFRKVADLIAGAHAKVIFLSPFTYSLTTSMEAFLNKFHITKIDRKLEYVKREIIKIGRSKDLRDYFGSAIAGYQKNSSVPKKVKILLTQLYPQSSIVYVSNYSKAYEVALALEGDMSNHPDVRYQAFMRHIRDNFLVEGREIWAVYDGLNRGVGIYIAPLPRYIKKEIIRLFEAKILSTLVVTSAFTEGVNTCASNLIFTSLVNGPTANKLSDIDVLNVAGRAGRFAKNTVGKIFCTSDDVYDRVHGLQESSNIRLENYNYKKSDRLLDFEYEMMDETYLNYQQKNQLHRQTDKLRFLNLNRRDLNISLNVSNNWKLQLYEYFNCLPTSEIEEIQNKIEEIYEKEEGKRVAAIEYIFRSLQKAFINTRIDIFPRALYEIAPFTKANEFTWGRLYQIYLSGSPKKIIARNIKYITSEFARLTSGYRFQNKGEYLEQLLSNNQKGWILKYYNKDLSLNMNAFYTETFKIISNIIQYKIPFYLTFYVSIFQLYIRKNHIQLACSESTNFDLTKLINIFEEGEADKEYEKLLDYGLPLTTITKLSDNKISIESVKNSSYDRCYFDEYENILLDETAQYL